MSDGSPFQAFYLLFKTNAKESKKDVKELREELGKAKKETEETKDEVSELGKSFTNAVEDATRALAAYASFSAIKAGIINTQEFNRALTTQTKLWGQNANEINAYGKAVKALGGSEDAAGSWYAQIRNQNAQQGMKTLPIGQLMDRIHNQIKGMSPEAAQMIFGQLGINDPGQQTLLRQNDEDYMKSVANARELTKNTEMGSEAAKEFGTAWDNLTTSLQKFWTTANTQILPIFTAIFEGMTWIINLIGNNKAASVAFFTALTAGAVGFTACIPALIAGFGSIATAAYAMAIPLALLLGRITALIAVATWLPGASKKGGAGIAHWINRQFGRGDDTGILPGHAGYSGPGSATGDSGGVMSYLMNKHGLDANHAAAIAANLQHESAFDPYARGDGGLAQGLAQWHPDRRAKILAGTGIDVSTASREKQLDALMWEMKDRGQLDAFLSQKDPYSAASYFSQKYESPAGGIAEAMARGNTAIDLAGATPFSAGNVGAGGGAPMGNVQIDRIEVNTQATDADGIARAVAPALQREIANVHAQNNDAMSH